MVRATGRLLVRIVSAAVALALVVVGAYVLFDVLRAAVTAVAFLIVGYVAWRIVRSMNR